ncbi:C-terminal binding protein [Gilliamella apicola]|jgi:Phosphoglycerate dehydrogenase and related dehydrogenases|uniref:C-terminal binding protein n=1 Tax=Gilliamella apicola TaxID=1196095 RepID=A0A2V4E7Q9_9GAMM|nr:C-terminal binding protein [Gilliamella apicola]PXZ08593.1 C-terminal binding protein [Gilliamella apicola]
MKIYITDCDHESMDIEKKTFTKEGVDFEILNVTQPEDIIRACHDADALILQYATISDNVLSSLKNLKGVVRYGVGVNTIDIESATKNNVAVCNVPDYGTNEVADHALALIMALARKLPLLIKDTKSNIWAYEKAIPIYRLQEQTAGIIGLGRIGLSLAKKLHGIGLKVIGFDPLAKKEQLPDYIDFVSLDELLAHSDIISLNLPLTKSTENLIDSKEFSKMKSNCYLVNTARGGIVNEEALYQALLNHTIAGAALDVFKQEPPTDRKLFSLDNFIATPHAAWYSEQSQQDLKRKAAEEAIRLAKGEKPLYCLNK